MDLIKKWTKKLNWHLTKMIYRWKVSVWKDVQYPMSLENCKLKQHWLITTYLVIVRMTKIQKNRDNTSRWWECGALGTKSLPVGMLNGAAISGDQFLTKLQVLLLYNPAIALVVIYQRTWKLTRRNLYRVLIAALT